MSYLVAVFLLIAFCIFPMLYEALFTKLSMPIASGIMIVLPFMLPALIALKRFYSVKFDISLFTPDPSSSLFPSRIQYGITFYRIGHAAYSIGVLAFFASFSTNSWVGIEPILRALALLCYVASIALIESGSTKKHSS